DRDRRGRRQGGPPVAQEGGQPHGPLQGQRVPPLGGHGGGGGVGGPPPGRTPPPAPRGGGRGRRPPRSRRGAPAAGAPPRAYPAVSPTNGTSADPTTSFPLSLTRSAHAWLSRSAPPWARTARSTSSRGESCAPAGSAARSATTAPAQKWTLRISSLFL